MNDHAEVRSPKPGSKTGTGTRQTAAAIQSPFFRPRWKRPIMLLCVILFMAFFLFSCGTHCMLMREISQTPRDPITGIVLGTEAVTLYPPSVAAGSAASTTSTTAATTAAPLSQKPRVACLLIHGFLASRQDYADLGECLAARGMVVRMMRLPGHGTTPVDFAYQPDGALCRAVHEEYARLRAQYDRVYVVGFSMGGALASLLASEEKVDKLVLLAPYFGVTYKWYYILPAETWNGALRWVIDYIPRPRGFTKVNDKSAIGKFFYYGILPTSGARQLMALGRQARRPETLTRIQCPVLMIHSLGDEAASPARAREAFGRIGSKAKQDVWLTRSNHMLIWDYDKEEVKRRVEDFIVR